MINQAQHHTNIFEVNIMSHDDDEWSDLRERFKSENIDFKNLGHDEQLIYVWRWLVDTEINLQNSMRINNKLREQQNEELDELKDYVGKVREISEKRTIDIENESTKLQQQISNISIIIDQVPLQENTVIDKISKLVNDHLRLTEEIQILNKLKLSHPHSEDLLTEMITVSTEKEVLKRELMEASERMQIIQKDCRELELDNEKLAFKLSEAFAELEDKEIRIGELTTVHPFDLNSRFCDSNKSTLSRLDTDNLNLKNDFSLDYRTESTSPSLFSNEITDHKVTSKLGSLMSSCQEIARQEENKKLQSECESLKSQISLFGEKYNSLALKYVQLKSKKKFQIEELRTRLDACLCQIDTLQVQISVQRQRLRAEEIFRSQIESDLRKLQDEKRHVALRLQNSETELKENNREVTIMQKKISMLDSANSDLLSQLLKLKYKESRNNDDNENVVVDSCSNNII